MPRLIIRQRRVELSRVVEAFTYEPNTGEFRWRERPRSHFRSDRTHTGFNRHFAGKAAFTTLDSHGYLVAKMEGRKLYAHRVAWALCTGEWPEAEIDHANGSSTDNRLANLRECTSAENKFNTSRRKHSAWEYKGVFRRGQGPWLARIRAGKQAFSLGPFGSAIEAARAYDAAALRLHGEFARLNFPVAVAA